MAAHITEKKHPSRDTACQTDAAPSTSKLIDGITFDDVLLVPAYSDVVPSQVDVATRLTRRIMLNIPVLSAPMDTVTNAPLAIALAQEGGLGVIHKNQSIESQAQQVRMTKRSANGVIADPIVLRPDAPVGDVRELMQKHGISGVPVTEDGRTDGRVVGILTRRDMMFLHEDVGKHVRDVMTQGRLVTAPPGTTLQQAEQILNRNKVEKLLLVDDAMRLNGLITMRDIDKLRQFPLACRDERGRLRVGAAVGVNHADRVTALINAEVDLIVVDSAHGHSRNVIEAVRQIKKDHDIDVIAGNVATRQGTEDLIDAGADAVKVGIGPGSICTTRIVTGVGVPQISAVMDACRAADAAGIPIIADGGIRQSGDLTKALAAGASAVMLGSLLAGLDESPGAMVIHMGRRYKAYRGMGSQGAMMAGSADRYGQAEMAGGKYVPEGVEGRVPYRGPLGDYIFQIIGGLRAGMGYCGAHSIDQLRKDARFSRLSSAGLVESHPHDITITTESPNYTVEHRRDG